MALPTMPNGSTDVRLETPANTTSTQQTELTVNQGTGATETSKIIIINQK